MRKLERLEQYLHHKFPLARLGELEQHDFHFIAEQLIEQAPDSPLIAEMFDLNLKFGYELEYNPNLYKWAFMNRYPTNYVLVEKHMHNKPVEAALHAAISHDVSQGVSYLAQRYPEIVFQEKHFVTALNYHIVSSYSDRVVNFYFENLDKVSDLGAYTLERLQDLGHDEYTQTIKAYLQAKALREKLPEKGAGIKMKI